MKKIKNSPRQVTRRLVDGQDLRKEIEKIVEEYNVCAGCILSAVGSLKAARLRLAGAKVTRSWRKVFEIVSITGTVSRHGCHIHISVADGKREVLGGHLAYGCVVRTTAEIVLLAFDSVSYERAKDSKTGYDELVIR